VITEFPNDWRRFPHRSWPTLYLLHGCCDGTTGYQSWTTKTDVEAFTARANVLIVMPDGGTGGFYSDWLTGPKWETFHLTELRQILERQYHSGPQRVVAGLLLRGSIGLSAAGGRLRYTIGSGASRLGHIRRLASRSSSLTSSTAPRKCSPRISSALRYQSESVIDSLSDNACLHDGA
ncbi:alpha/beta hydrolase-fold protein, partial [Kibdelosporangium lantanae]